MHKPIAKPWKVQLTRADDQGTWHANVLGPLPYTDWAPTWSGESIKSSTKPSLDFCPLACLMAKAPLIPELITALKELNEETKLFPGHKGRYSQLIALVEQDVESI